MKLLIPVVIALALKTFNKEVEAVVTIIRLNPFESAVIVGLITIITMLTIQIA